MTFEVASDVRFSQRLSAIVCGAASLLERLDERWVPDERRRAAAVCEGRLEDWRRTVAGAAPALFDRRLAFLSPAGGKDRLRVCVGPVRLADTAEPPAWTGALDGILAAAMGPLERADRARFLDPEEPVPFEDVLAPIVRWASGRLFREAMLEDGVFSDSCLGALERLLLHGLARVSSVALMHQFALFRLQGGFAPDDRVVAASGYQAFCREVSADGMQTLLSRYPVLARLLPTLVEHWLEACGELAGRVRADRETLRWEFGCVAPLGPVREIRAGLSDPHARGRMVAALTFENGLTVVYKPHDLKVAEAFSELLTWLAKRGAGPGLRPLRVLTCEGYGWMELAEHRPCRDGEEVRLYYRRAGGLLCLAYLLNGTDFHFENLIACGAHPVLVDLEMLFHPPLESPGEGARARVRRDLDDSVLRTGLLPGWQIGEAGEVYDISGFTGVPGQETSLFGRRWEHVNTDAMALRFEPVRVPARQNLPVPRRPEGARLGARGRDRGGPPVYLSGTESSCAVSSPRIPWPGSRGSRSVTSAGPRRPMGGSWEELTEPAALSDGVSFGLALEKLWQAFLGDEARRPLAALVDFEAQALARLDVPLFHLRTDSRSIWAGEEIAVAEAFTETGHVRMLRRLSDFCEADLERQVGLLRSSLFTRREGDGHEKGVQEESAAEERSRPPGGEEAVEAALAIARVLESEPCGPGTPPPGSPSGWTLGRAPTGSGPWPRDLYNGCCGVAVFLAAAAKLGGREELPGPGARGPGRAADGPSARPMPGRGWHTSTSAAPRGWARSSTDCCAAAACWTIPS